MNNTKDVHNVVIVGFGNRGETMFRWGYATITNNRRERIISSEQIAQMK